MGNILAVLICSHRPGDAVDMAYIVGERNLLRTKHTEGAEKDNQQAETGPMHRFGAFRAVNPDLIGTRR